MAKDRNVVRLYKEKLNLLLDVAQTINEDTSVDDLMQEFEILLTEELHIGKILVYTHDDEGWKCILQSNVDDAQRDAIDIERDLGDTTSSIRNLSMEEKECFAGFDTAIPLMHKYKLMGYVLVGDTELGEGVSPTLRNLKFVQILSNIIIVFIENKKMQARVLEQEALKRELAVAAKIQNGLIPEQLPQTTHTKILSYYKPHAEVGGDYFDVLQLSKNVMGFCMADVSGHGVAAALLMSNFQAMMRALFTANTDLLSLTQELNTRVGQNTHGEKFITMFLGRYDNLTGTLTYVNAGHLPPLLWQSKTNIVSELMTGGIGLGMLDEMPGLEMGKVKLNKGDLLLTYTDGLVEVESNGVMESNLDKLMDIMKRGMGIDQTMKEVSAMADETRVHGKSFDDTSVLAIEVTKKSILPFSL